MGGCGEYFPLQIAGGKSYKRLADNRSAEARCHSKLERSGGEESRPTGGWMRDSSAYGLRMTGQQNQCGELLNNSALEGKRRDCGLH